MTTPTAAASVTAAAVPFRPSAVDVHAYAVEAGVCVRPLVRRLVDTETGEASVVTLRCGSTREAVCPTCAAAARRLRMHQCAEGWHRDDEPEHADPTDPDDTDDTDDNGQSDENDDDGSQGVGGDDDGSQGDGGDEGEGERRARSTRRRRDVSDLPRVPMADRTIGRTFTDARTGHTYRPSMFVTLTLPSYGRVVPGRGVPVDPARYDYRRAALDALHFSKVVDRWVQNLRRSCGFKAQYFAAVEPQRRLAPHLHAAIRGAIPRATIKAVTKGTYHQVWWPAFDVVVHDAADPDCPGGGLPVWDPAAPGGPGYVHPTTRVPLPTWRQALDQLDADPHARPAHVVRLGTQVDVKGITAPSPDADRAVRYLTKYLTKSMASTTTPAAYAAQHHDANDLDDLAGDRDIAPDPAMTAHVDRLAAELRWLPCSPRCANWLRHGVQPQHAEPGMTPGNCDAPAHDRDHLGVGGRRCLVSRNWSGKTLTQHRADRRDVVHQVLAAAGISVHAAERCAATVTCDDGTPRFRWEPLDRDRDNAVDYAHAITNSAMQRAAWRRQYDTAKATAAQRDGPPDGAVHNSLGNASRPPGETAA